MSADPYMDKRASPFYTQDEINALTTCDGVGREKKRAILALIWARQQQPEPIPIKIGVPEGYEIITTELSPEGECSYHWRKIDGAEGYPFGMYSDAVQSAHIHAGSSRKNAEAPT